jgi:hypothetical protein
LQTVSVDVTDGAAGPEEHAVTKRRATMTILRIPKAYDEPTCREPRVPDRSESGPQPRERHNVNPGFG